MSTYVIKFGGNAMIDPALECAFATDIAELRAVGNRVVVVHGGGPQINAHLDHLGIASNFIAGLRRTSAEAMGAIRMVLVGQVQRELVNRINDIAPARAFGMSGEDAQLFTVRPQRVIVDGQSVDLGFVGDIVDVDCSFLEIALDDGRIPVISSIGRDGHGQVYNVNADAAAGAIAAALQADRLLILTDVDGMYEDWPACTARVEQIDVRDLERILLDLTQGMLPKMTACVTALRGGTRSAQIVNGTRAHVVKHAIVTNEPIGTKVIDNEQLQDCIAVAAEHDAGVPRTVDCIGPR